MRGPSVSLVVLLGAGVPAQELSSYELPAAVATRIRAQTDDEPFRLLGAIASADLGRRQAAEAKWEALDERSQCALIRAGLRSSDAEVAAGAAVKAADHSQWLDTSETKRAARAGLARCNGYNTPFDVANFFDLLDGEDAALLLAAPGPRPREMVQFIGPLHHRLGPEHWAQVELLAYGDDVLLQRDAEHYLGFVKSQRLRYGHFLLSRPIEPAEWPEDFDPVTDRMPYEPRKVDLRPKGDGYHPVLAALLEDLFLSERKLEGRELTFAWRWAISEDAGEIDRPLLVRLAASPRHEAKSIAIAGLSAIGGEDVVKTLRQSVEGLPDTHVDLFFALGELTRRGDADARQRLIDLAAERPGALAVLWRVERERAVDLLDAVELKHVLDAIDEGAIWGAPMDGIDVALVGRAGRLDAVGLGRLLADVPTARSPDLLARAIAALDASNVDDMPLGVLEFGGAAALAGQLHAILADDELTGDLFETTMGALVRLEPALLGDDATVLALFDRCGALRDFEARASLQLRIAAARGDVVRDRLLAPLDDADPASVSVGTTGMVWNSPAARQLAGMLAAAVAACGVDYRSAAGLMFELTKHGPTAAQLTAARTAMRGPLLRGDGVAAIGALLALDMGIDLGHLRVWTLPDEVALPALQRGLEQRERGEYLDAVGQLARRGDQAARAEVERAIRRRLYRWIDRLGVGVLTDGKSLDRVPLLLSQVDSNCCTYAVIASALEEVFEVDAFTNENGVRSRPARLRATWERGRDRLRWSRIADRWLIVPE